MRYFDTTDPGAPQSIDSPAPVRRLLGIWAHPDDESYLSAAAMAEVVDAGGEVVLVAITDGEAGFPDDDPRSREERVAQRRAELRSAMAVIGVRDVRFLGVADGGVHLANVPELTARLTSIIVEFGPDAIMTFGPEGVTGHPDHMVTSDIVTAAWCRLRIGELWYAAKTTTWLDEWRELHDELGVWMTEEPVGVEDDDLEMVVRCSGAELDRKRAVLAAHRSQTEAISVVMGETVYRRWIAEEAFRRPTSRELRAAVGRAAVMSDCRSLMAVSA